MLKAKQRLARGGEYFCKTLHHLLMLLFAANMWLKLEKKRTKSKSKLMFTSDIRMRESLISVTLTMFLTLHLKTPSGLRVKHQCRSFSQLPPSGHCQELQSAEFFSNWQLHCKGKFLLCPDTIFGCFSYYGFFTEYFIH